MSVSEFLDYFDRLRNASASAAYGALVDPDSSALSSGWKGFTGDEHRSWGDVLGIEEGTPDDGWIEWLAKNGVRLGLDMTLDPANLFFGAGAISKGLGLAKGGVSAAGRLANWSGVPKLVKAGYYNSPAFQVLGGTVPSWLDDSVEPMIQASQRTGSVSRLDDAARAGYAELTPLVKSGVDPLEAFTAIETRQIPENMQGLATAIEPLQTSARENFEQITALLDKLGVSGDRARQLLDETDQAYLPHMQTRASQRSGTAGRTLGDIRYEPDTDLYHRNIMNWVDEDQVGVTIGKLGDKRTGVTRLGPDDAPQYWHGGEIKRDTGLYEGGEQVYPKQALLEQKAAEYPEASWVTDPVAATYETARKRQEMVNFLSLVDTLQDEGKLVRTGGLGGNMNDLRPGLGADWRQVQLPGFSDFEAPKYLATRLENLGSGFFGGQPLARNWVEDIAGRVGESQLGQAVGDLTTWWKHNVLPYPGWVAGNIGSNTALLQQAGITNPMRLVEAATVQSGKGTDVVSGISNARLWNEMVDRGVTNSGFGVSSFGNPLSQAIEGEGRVRTATDRLTNMTKGAGHDTTASLVDTAGRAAAWTGERIGDYNKWFMGKIGAPVENNARLAAAIDYVKKNAPDFAKLSPDAQARVLDDAARFAKDALIDYGDMSPFIKQASKAIPFLPWMRGITGRTLDVATTAPQRLANTERIMDAFTTPLSDEDKAVSDAWLREQSPVRAGWLGDLIGGGQDSVMLTGRYMPQGNLQQAISRPADFAVSNVSPFVKLPYELIANKNTFKDRPLDRLAGSFPGNLTNPITGGPYELAGHTVFGTELPAGIDYVSQQMPWGRGVSTINDLGRQAGLWTDPYKAEGSLTEGLAYAGTGGKLMPFDASRYQAKRANEQKKKIQDIQFLLKLALQKGDMQGVEHYSYELTRAMSQTGAAFLEGG